MVPLGTARNLAIEKACGKFLAFLDCDDLWLPSKLSHQVAVMEAGSPSARPFGMCYTDAMRIDAEGNDLIAYSTSVGSWKETFTDFLYRTHLFQCLARS